MPSRTALPTPTWRCCAATPATGCRAWPASGEKTAAKLIEKYGTLVALRQAVDSGDPEIKGAQRTRLEAGAAYLDVAPKVVQVAPDAPVAEVDMLLPSEVADPVLMSKIASEFGVTSSFNRVLSALRIE